MSIELTKLDSEDILDMNEDKNILISTEIVEIKMKPKRKRKNRKEKRITQAEKDYVKSKFMKLDLRKNVCVYCSYIVENDHISRYITFFKYD